MQLPFTVSPRAVRRPGLRRPARTWWVCAIVGAIMAAVVNSLGVWRWSAQGAADETSSHDAGEATEVPEVDSPLDEDA